MVITSGDAAQRWRAELAAWAIPPEIIAAAPESPWGAPPECFPPPSAHQPDTPSRRRALDVLPLGGAVLDIGCGGGAAGLSLAPPAGRLVGVDESLAMLATFAAAAQQRGIGYAVVEGRWPDVADAVDQADVVVSHHVTYNVPDLPPFVRMLSERGRHRVVLEMTATHPLVALAPLWRHFHGLDRPTGPTADLCRDVLVEAGVPVTEERFTAPARPVPFATRVSFTRKRLCLPVEREPEVAEILREQGQPPPRDLVTLWWDQRPLPQLDSRR